MVALGVLAMSWPVLDLLGRNAEFFVARGSSATEIVWLLLALAVGVPLVLALPALIPGWLGRVVASIEVGLMVALLAYLVFRRFSFPVGVTEAIAIGWGIWVALLLQKSAGMASAVRLLAWSPAAIIAFFLLATPAGGLVTGGGARVGSAVEPETSPPIVFIVFDEFPLASLIDPAGNLRTERYPNFGRLAADGTWFRNAVTVQQQTEHSLPAILTGIDPDLSLNPYAGQYPGSLFTALSGSYRMDIQETMTRLCPVTVCERVPDVATRGVGPLVRDVGVVAGHTLLPPWATVGLPLIDRNWGSFGEATEDFNAIEAFNEARVNDPRLPLDNLVRSISEDRGNRPTFHFAHVLLPHNPWQFLPTGQRYPLDAERLPGSASTGWGENAWLSAQALQRHLLQVGAVDSALGEVLDALEEAGIYDKSLIVVVADHGIALRPNIEHWRRIEPDTVGAVAAVPLFVKSPGGTGAIDDRRALTIDIVPTIADLLGFELPWRSEGVSLFGPDPERTESTTTGPRSAATYGVSGDEVRDVAQAISSWFPTGDPYELLPPGAPDLVGQPTSAIPNPDSSVRARIDRPDRFEEVDPDGETIPARVTGTLVGLGEAEETLLAISVNGTIEAIVSSYHDRGKTGFQAMIPPDRFRSGANDVVATPFSP